MSKYKQLFSLFLLSLILPAAFTIQANNETNDVAADIDSNRLTRSILASILSLSPNTDADGDVVDAEPSGGLITTLLSSDLVGRSIQGVLDLIELKVNAFLAIKNIFSYENVRSCLLLLRRVANYLLRLGTFMKRILPDPEPEVSGLQLLSAFFPKVTFVPETPVRYGVPPVNPSVTYGPPPEKPSETYGPPEKPSETYGPPSKPSETYGPPVKPSATYGPPSSTSTSTTTTTTTTTTTEKPTSPAEVYGPPLPYEPPRPIEIPENPFEEYGPPKEEYGVPAEEYGPPEEEYGPPGPYPIYRQRASWFNPPVREPHNSF